MKRPYNFGAGPAMLPQEILLEAQEEFLNWKNTGMSVLEVGHRTSLFTELLAETAEELKSLLAIPEGYHILFLGAAARTQFSTIPLNLLNDSQSGAYLDSGLWSSMAYSEAQRLKRAYRLASAEQSGYKTIPCAATWSWQENTAYFYFTPNETVNGLRCSLPSHLPNVPVIADMTSCLLTEPFSIQDYALIFAGAQKNIANAGLTLVIIREDLLAGIHSNTLPTMLDYRTHVQQLSLYATPPTFNCYLAQKMFKWVSKKGGVEALYAVNQKKAKLLYDFIEQSDFYQCDIDKNYRSLVNICFTLTQPQHESLFLEQAAQQGLLAFLGHRTVGGLRASLYNAMPLEGVIALVEFMEHFAKAINQ